MKGMKAVGKYGSIGFELLASMAIGYYGGRWLDGHFHTSYLKWIGFVVGVYTGFKALFRLAKQMEKDVARQEALDRGDDPWADEHEVDEEGEANANANANATSTPNATSTSTPTSTSTSTSTSTPTSTSTSTSTSTATSNATSTSTSKEAS